MLRNKKPLPLIGPAATTTTTSVSLTTILITVGVIASIGAIIGMGVKIGISNNPPLAPTIRIINNPLHLEEWQFLEVDWPIVIRAGGYDLIYIQVSNLDEDYNASGIAIQNSLGTVYCEDDQFTTNVIALLEPGQVTSCYAIYSLNASDIAANSVTSTSSYLAQNYLLELISGSTTSILTLKTALFTNHTILASDNSFYVGPCNPSNQPIGGPSCPGPFLSTINATWLCDNSHFVKCAANGTWIVEYTVPKGTTGAVGVAGVAGSNGATGGTGAQGLAGTTGATGATGNVVQVSGATGGQGPSGLPGSSGTTGATGSEGPSGYSGATGATGVAGAGGSSFITTGDCGDNITSVASLGTTPSQLCTFERTNSSLYCRDNGHLFECNGTLWIYQSMIGPVYSNTCNASLNNTATIGGKTCNFNTSTLVCINLDYHYTCNGINWILTTELPVDYFFARSNSTVGFLPDLSIPFTLEQMNGGGITVNANSTIFTIQHSGIYVVTVAFWNNVNATFFILGIGGLSYNTISPTIFDSAIITVSKFIDAGAGISAFSLSAGIAEYSRTFISIVRIVT